MTFEDFKPIYMMNLLIQDSTAKIYVSFAREQAEAIMGMSAQAFMEMRENKS